MKTVRTSEELKEIVKEKYAQVAEGPSNEGCCGVSCGCSTGAEADVSMAENYTQLPGYAPDADLGLGCGLPTEFAMIRPGDVVLDLGSGAGNDAFVARAITGAEGKVIGVDITEKMVEKARVNATKLGYDNIEFRLGDIEKMPVEKGTIDVVISNCVLNLVPDKRKAFEEIFRVLRPGGHFSVSDVVVKGLLPDGLLTSAELYAGCISGASQKDEYLRIVKEAGFTNITVQKERRIELPEALLAAYLGDEEKKSLQDSNSGVYSVTIFAKKPSTSGE